MFFLKKIGCKPFRKRFTAYKYKIYEVFYFISSIAACAAAKIRYFSMSYIILLNNIRLFNFFVSVYYD